MGCVSAPPVVLIPVDKNPELVSLGMNGAEGVMLEVMLFDEISALITCSVATNTAMLLAGAVAAMLLAGVVAAMLLAGAIAAMLLAGAFAAVLLAGAFAAAVAALLLGFGVAPWPFTTIDCPVVAFKQPVVLHTSTLPWLVVINN